MRQAMQLKPGRSIQKITRALSLRPFSISSPCDLNGEDRDESDTSRHPSKRLLLNRSPPHTEPPCIPILPGLKFFPAAGLVLEESVDFFETEYP